VIDPKTGHVRGSQLFLLIVHQVTVQHLQYHSFIIQQWTNKYN